ncbi:MAG: ATP-binding protein [Oscillatoriophycideae cyanobacterium NC_groundwater_1537_Pr4_S-0.65um_50_18]|nr:ATP-binding protein [Oscillatoriophycideae cyanobacterium NC_groundwater_1537_Pr4_S-0.65um_50_18]
MSNNPFFAQHWVSHQHELQQINQILAQDGDLLVVGAPGIGRRSLIRAAARQVGARIVEIDFLRTTNADRFLRLLADGVTEAFADAQEMALIQDWSQEHAIGLEQSPPRARLVWQAISVQSWTLFQTLLSLPQIMAERLDCRVVIVFQNFPHIRSWDRTGEWENYLRQEIQRQSRVSYALISTIAEPWMQGNLKLITLAPLDEDDLRAWLVSTMASQGMRFDHQALERFLSYVQGHLGDAIALARRVWLDHAAAVNHKANQKGIGLQTVSGSESLIYADDVYQSALSLTEDLSITFESLILLLPPSQVRVLESLALDPTDKPHARDYIQKHQLSRGGGLQGALSSLEQKGLVYGAKFGYRITMPLLAFWLKQRLS